MRRVGLIVLALAIVLALVPVAFAQEEIVHVVQPGENLYRISLRYGKTYQEVAAYNGITNPALIYVGQHIRIPGVSGGAPAPSGGGVLHTVQRGENLYRIALRYERTYQEIAAYNGLANPTLIYVGQQLRIPGTSVGTPATTAAPAPSGPSAPFGYGIQVHLIGVDRGQVLDAVQDLGVSWVKQQIEWAVFEPTPGNIDWATLDGIVSDVRGRGLFLLLSVVKAPDWARTTAVEDGPPADYRNYAQFVGALAERYRGQGIAYEIWNEQNLRREWNGAPLSAAEYVEMLQLAYEAIHAADPNAIVVSGGLAPTGINDGMTAIDDRVYLAQMYQAGLANYSDAIGAHPNGWANPPDSVCCNTTPDVLTHDDHPSFFFLQTLREYRAIMERFGDGGTRIWLTEMGWGSNENISPTIVPGYEFVGYTSEAEQATYVARSFELAQGLGYVGPTFLWNLNFCSVVGDEAEQCYWGLVRPDWSHRPVYDAVRGATP